MTIAVVGKSQATSGANSVISLAVAKPTGTVEGHHMICALTMNNTQTTVTPAAGWTEIHHQVDGTCNLYLWHKVAGASEPASYTFSWGASGGGICTIISRSGVDNTTPIVSGESGIAPCAGGTHAPTRTTPTITTAGTRMIVSTFANPYGFGWTGGTDTEEYNLQRSLAASIFVQDAASVAAGSISRSVTTTGGDTGAGAQSIVALNPAAVGLSATASVDVSSGTAPLDVTCTIVPTGGTGSYTASFDWGDGTSDVDQTVMSKSHTYANAGTYEIGWSVSG